MVDEITFQTIFQFLQTVSIIVGIAYYFMVLNNQQKNQKLRATYDVLEVFRDEKWYYKWSEVLNLEWVDYEDFIEKYGSHANPEMAAKWNTMFQYYDGLGLLWKKGLLNLDDFSPIMGVGCLMLWIRYKPVIDVFRSRYITNRVSYWGQLCDALEPLVKDKFGPDNREIYFPSEVLGK